MPEAIEPTITPNRWYGFLESCRLGRKPLLVKRLGEEFVLYRKQNGNPVCMLNRCPHRGMPMNKGRLFGDEIECPYHGFRFGGDGACSMMPCEGKDAKIPNRMRTITFCARDANKIVWVWWGAEPEELGLRELPDPPWIHDMPDTPYTNTMSFEWPMGHRASIEAAIDGHHAPILHGQRRGIRGWKIGPIVGKLTRLHDLKLDYGDDWLDARYEFRSQDVVPGKKVSRFNVRVQYKDPGLVNAQISNVFAILTVDTPIDETRSWRIIRYYNISVKIPLLGHFMAWLFSRGDQAMIQWAEDYWIIKGQKPPVPGVYGYNYVSADKVVGTYYSIERKQAAIVRRNYQALPPIVQRHFPQDAEIEATEVPNQYPVSVA